ncbi:MAG: hypothetical protein RIS44_231 [Pseudomonadota bacterium]|jgi:type I restriction enzyme S subunit
MREWVECRLTDIAAYHNGLAFKPSDWSEDGLPIIRIEQLNNPEGPSDRYLGEVPEVNRIRDGDLLFSWSATLKVVIWKHGEGALNQHLFKVVPKEDFEVRFVYYLLDWCMDALSAGSHGSTMKHIKRSELQKFKVRVPSIRAQRRISQVLNSIDTAIEKTEALIAKHQQIKAGLMHDLFTRGVLPNGQLRPKESLVLTPLGRLPDSWRLGSILELTDPLRQPILTGPFGADLGSSDFVDEGVPVLRIGNVQQGFLDLSNLLHVSDQKASTLARYRIQTGDLLFARQGATTGRNALADDRANGSLINYHIIRVALDEERCAPLFVEAAFASDVVKRQIERDKGRGTREGINTAQLTSLEFPIAPVDEQRRIAELLSRQNKVIATTQHHQETLQKQKLGLMQDLLTGRVPVPAAPEPAEAAA